MQATAHQQSVEDAEDEEMQRRMRNAGFTDEETLEVMSQGAQPWHNDMSGVR